MREGGIHLTVSGTEKGLPGTRPNYLRSRNSLVRRSHLLKRQVDEGDQKPIVSGRLESRFSEGSGIVYFIPSCLRGGGGHGCCVNTRETWCSFGRVVKRGQAERDAIGLFRFV